MQPEAISSKACNGKEPGLSRPCVTRNGAIPELLCGVYWGARQVGGGPVDCLYFVIETLLKILSYIRIYEWLHV